MKMIGKLFFYMICLVSTFTACAQEHKSGFSELTESGIFNDSGSYSPKKNDMRNETNLTEEEWKKKLTPEQFHICREKGTERAFTGKYYNSKEKGIYKCVACGNPLFNSDAKFDSGTGWPSFYAPYDKTKITEHLDKSYGMLRTEVTCSQCGSHLGHLFNDGPEPTGMRYCINSVSLELEKK